MEKLIRIAAWIIYILVLLAFWLLYGPEAIVMAVFLSAIILVYAYSK